MAKMTSTVSVSGATLKLLTSAPFRLIPKLSVTGASWPMAGGMATSTANRVAPSSLVSVVTARTWISSVGRSLSELSVGL